MFFCKCALIPGNLLPEVPTIDRLPTLPRLLKSKSVRPTTPTFLSDDEAVPLTYPVVYSPVPTMHTLSGAMAVCFCLRGVSGYEGEKREWPERGRK